jgi:hypothetical protein
MTNPMPPLHLHLIFHPASPAARALQPYRARNESPLLQISRAKTRVIVGGSVV